MVKQIKKRTPEEKERIIQDIQRLGVIAGCRKYAIYATTYYDWLNKYTAEGLEGLKDKRSHSQDGIIKKQDKEIRLLKEILAEKELTIKMQAELIKKSYHNRSEKINCP